jgi:hypothetical protein
MTVERALDYAEMVKYCSYYITTTTAPSLPTTPPPLPPL